LLSDVLALNLRTALHVGNGPRDLQYPVMGRALSPVVAWRFQHSFVSLPDPVGADLRELICALSNSAHRLRQSD